jgi:hypothetical protein
MRARSLLTNPLALAVFIQWVMLKRPDPEQTTLETWRWIRLVLLNPRLRKIDQLIDFSFIQDLTTPLYCPDNSRPPLDPRCMFHALFIGHLFGGALGASGGARDRGRRRVPLVPAAEADGQGSRRLDLEAEPASALPGRHDRSADLQPHRRAGNSAGPGRLCGAPSR